MVRPCEALAADVGARVEQRGEYLGVSVPFCRIQHGSSPLIVAGVDGRAGPQQGLDDPRSVAATNARTRINMTVPPVDELKIQHGRAPRSFRWHSWRPHGRGRRVDSTRLDIGTVLLAA